MFTWPDMDQIATKTSPGNARGVRQDEVFHMVICISVWPQMPPSLEAQYHIQEDPYYGGNFETNMTNFKDRLGCNLETFGSSSCVVYAAALGPLGAVVA